MTKAWWVGAMRHGLASLLLAAPAGASCPEPRPTDPSSLGGYAYGTSAVASFGGPRALVWYATEGDHAPDLSSSRADGVPDHVALASHITEEALASYASLGFLPPPADDEPGCDGGDGRLDVYLMAFASADGLCAPIRCVEQGPALRCSSFMIVERRPQDRGYASFEEGARTILPHELFHAVQNAHDAAMDRYWAEGTAQWAADRLAPGLDDLDHFLPAFLGQPGRPMDLPPGGVTAAFLYGSAIWPLFLDLRHGPGLLRDALALQGQGLGAHAAVAAALLAAGASPPDELLRFRAWNAATGPRADHGGYPEAASYPEVPYKPDPLRDSAEIQGVMAGLSAVYQPYQLGARQRLTLDADKERIRGIALPIAGGKVQLQHGQELPADLQGEGVVVLAGVNDKKTDAAYALRAVSPPTPPPDPTSPNPTSPAPSASSPAPPAPGAAEEPLEVQGGCSVEAPKRPTPRGWALGLALALVGRRIARARRPRTAPR